MGRNVSHGRRRRWRVPFWTPLALLVGFAAGTAYPTLDLTKLNLPEIRLPTIDLPDFSELRLPTPIPVQSTLIGRASVIDGDTVDLQGERVRFNGIDAPEGDQLCEAGGKRYHCGQESADALAEFLAKSRPLRCEFIERDVHGRFVGDCYREDGRSVAAWLVNNGYALDWPRYSNGFYAEVEKAAKAKKRGLWRGTFDKPWDWRAGIQTVAPPREVTTETTGFGIVSAGSCNIKGNIAADGERIYHVPGGKFYSQTKITLAKGERWFCSEEEAQSAGWRRSKR